MAKKVVSLSPYRSKPVKYTNRRKKVRSLFNKFFNYMKSDTYMFAPLFHPQSCLASSPAYAEEVFCEPTKKEEHKFLEDAEEYLKCDCYMYAPMVTDSASLHSVDKAQSGSVRDQAAATTDETRQEKGKTVNSSRDIAHDKNSDPMSRIMVKHNLVQKETVKRIVHQNCRSPSVPGKALSKKEQHRKIVVE